MGWIDKDKTTRTGKESIATQHGSARSTFRTWAKCDELANNKKYDQEAVELCLLHSRNDPYKGAYDRSKLEKERRTIMEDWGRYCTSLPKKSSTKNVGRGWSLRFPPGLQDILFPLLTSEFYQSCAFDNNRKLN